MSHEPIQKRAWVGGGLTGIVSGGLLLLLPAMSQFWVLLPGIALWVGIILFINGYIRRKDVELSNRILPIALSALVASTLLFFVLEHPDVRRTYALAVGVMFAVLMGWGIQVVNGHWHRQKVLRRFLVMVWGFTAFAWGSGLSALVEFFPSVWVSSLTLIAIAFGYSAIALLIWRQYYDVPRKALVFWASVVGIVLLQLVWSIRLLPLAYTAVGFLVTWMWYLLQLFIRFHLSSKGILWKQQARFLILNIVLLICILVYGIRWV